MNKGNKQEHLSEKERFCIEKMRKAGFSSEDVARALGRGKSTIDEEIRKNGGLSAYDHQKAHHRAYLKQYRKKRTCLLVAMDTGIRQNVEYYLYEKDWSPETISAHLKRTHRLVVSAKAIRKYIASRCLEYLLQRYGLRPKLRYTLSRLENRIFITDPKCVRDGYGHWEGDFIVCPQNTSVLLVLTERSTKETKIAYLSNRNNDTVNQTMVDLLADRNVTSLTLDNDIAFTKHKTLATMIDAPIYFTRPYRSTDKALVENTNRWIRQYVPKGTNLKTLSQKTIKKALDWLNERPRECLGWMTASLCAKQQEELLKFNC